MFVATIDWDVEGKIARRFANDIIARAVDRSNAIKFEDLVKLNLCQVHCITKTSQYSRFANNFVFTLGTCRSFQFYRAIP